MSDARGLLDRITAFRQRLEAEPDVLPYGTVIDDDYTSLALAEEIVETVAEPRAFEYVLRKIAGPEQVNESPPPPQLTRRARRLLDHARGLLDRQKAFTADPLFAGLSADANPTPIVDYHGETVAIMESALRLALSFPDSPSLQMKLCDGLDGVLAVVTERMSVQDRLLTQMRVDADRIDRLAFLYTAALEQRRADLGPIAALAEELLEEARQGKPLRYLDVPLASTRACPGTQEFPAPARYLAAHAISTAQVVARVSPSDYEWSARPLLPTVAALLADCGMMTVPLSLLAKTGPLTADEKRIVEAHPRASAEYISRLVPGGAPLVDAIAAHHERPDGTGYPKGRTGKEIPSLARLLAIADTYAALCSWRPHRPAHDTRSALTDILLMAGNGILDRDFAEYLLNLSFYPVGTVVEMSDGKVGMVAANHPNRLDPRSTNRPVVAILIDTDGTPLPRPEHIDLASADRGGIVRSLTIDRRRVLLGSRYPDLA